MYVTHIYLANGLHKAKMKNLRHFVSCLAQSSGRGCCCCRGLSVTHMYDTHILTYIVQCSIMYLHINVGGRVGGVGAGSIKL